MASSGKLGSGRSLLLTFDDGPEPVGALDSILGTLKRHQILAEFYVIGQEVKREPKKAQLIVIGGHQIQNHSWSHINLAKADKATVRDELAATQKAVQLATGVVPTKLRPPYGAGGWATAIDPELAAAAKALSLKIENWDIDTEDWKAPAGLGEGKMENIRGQLVGSKLTRLNVLMHVLQPTADGLPKFIEKMKEWGFGFARP